MEKCDNEEAECLRVITSVNDLDAEDARNACENSLKACYQQCEGEEKALEEKAREDREKEDKAREDREKEERANNPAGPVTEDK